MLDRFWLSAASSRAASDARVRKSMLTKRGEVAEQLARHSAPGLTMQRYSRLATGDMATALDALPRVAAPAEVAAGDSTRRDAERSPCGLLPRGERATLRSTGTDNTTAAQVATGDSTGRDAERSPCGPPDRRPRPEGGERSGDGEYDLAPAHAIPFAKPCGFEGTSVDSAGRKSESPPADMKNENPRVSEEEHGFSSGEGGIRTHGPEVIGTPVFETGPFSRSGTSP